MNIYEKILSVMQNVQYMAKDDEVAFSSTRYKALSEEKVTGIMRAELIRHKMVIYPIHQESSRTGQITHVDVVYRMVNVENPDEYIDIASCGDGADSQDKGSGKAMTYAFKYMWLRTFALPTGEDPDKISSAELDEKMKHICEGCGGQICQLNKKDGTPWPVGEIEEYTSRRFGKKLCGDCQKEAVKAGKEEERNGA